MRKLLGIFMTIALLYSISIPCYAAVILQQDIQNCSVYASYVSSGKWDNISVIDGNAEVITDNYTVSISGIEKNWITLRIVSIPATDTTAWSWFEECIGNKYKILSIFDIYYLDTEGNRINVDGETIRISNANEKTVVYAVATDGMVTELQGTVSENNILFCANGDHYYVLVEPTAANGGSADAGASNTGSVNSEFTNTGSSNGEAGSSLLTGDVNDAEMWMGISLLSICVWGWFVWEQRKKVASENTEIHK